jgi:hypothetical protein
LPKEKSHDKFSVNPSLLLLPDLFQHSPKESGKVSNRRGSGNAHQTIDSTVSKGSKGSSKHNSTFEDPMKKDPFKNPFMIKIYESGDIVSSVNPAFIEIDLNAWRKKYYLYGQKREHLEAESLIKLQREFFGQLVNEILEHASLAMQHKREEIRDTNLEQLFPPEKAPNQQDKRPIL